MNCGGFWRRHRRAWIEHGRTLAAVLPDCVGRLSHHLVFEFTKLAYQVDAGQRPANNARVMALTVRVLGEIEVARDGAFVPLPLSRKTRALLAYLALSGRPQRREHLVSMFWEVPFDPRGALRWSLSKLRALVDEPACKRIVATRDSVSFDSSSAAIDLLAIRDAARLGLETLSTERLVSLESAFRGELLEGLELLDCHGFQAWITAEREEARRLHATILQALIQHFQQTPDKALGYARSLARIAPFDERAQRTLVETLARSGRRGEAERQAAAAKLALREAGIESSEGLVAASNMPPVVSCPADTGAADELKIPLEFPDKPSIAVLPFRNLSGDPEQEYFADGVAEDIIAGISRVRWLFVIARNSSFTYKGQSVDVTRVGRDLGVRYVLDGSVRKSGHRVRVTAQLVDATTGNQIWAERYDRVLQDIFAVQDEITQAIVAAIEPELGKAEQRRATSKRPENLGAWDLYQQGMWHLYHRTKDELAEAVRLLRSALDRDPTLAPALAGLVDAYYYEVVLSLSDDPAAAREKALAAARQAVELDTDDAAAHCAMGKARLFRREHAAAVPELELAIELNPSLAWAHYGLGAATVFSGGDAADAIPHLQAAIRLSPRDLHMGSFMVRLADAYNAMGEYEDAADWARKSLRQPNFQWSRYVVLLSALGHLGRTEEAGRVLEEFLTLRADFSISFVRMQHLYTDNDNFAHLIDGLRKAGVAD